MENDVKSLLRIYRRYIFSALWIAGMGEEARGLLAPMWLLVGAQLGALGYGRRHEGAV